ncbi:DnaB-like helicase C-terminal domain-containing protein [Butyricimonas virosa]|uniref:DnaB-like helicase C-terminal domain-containing protein n=1 Tax=Butyricimonas virosa TaxID=544645 RepID=UPI003AB00BD0
MVDYHRNLIMFVENLKQHRLSIIGGRPAMGKTTLALYISHEMIKEKISTVFFSLELSSIQLARRIHELFDDIVIESELYEKKKQVYLHGYSGQCFWKIHQYGIIENISLDKLEKDITNYALQDNSRIIIIDYVQLLMCRCKLPKKKGFAILFSRLRSLANMYKLTIILLSQLSCTVDTRMYPKYSDLLGFKEIIDFNFDNVYLINRPEKYGVLYGKFGEEVRGITEVYSFLNAPQKYLKLQLKIKY